MNQLRIIRIFQTVNFRSTGNFSEMRFVAFLGVAKVAASFKQLSEMIEPSDVISLLLFQLSDQGNDYFGQLKVGFDTSAAAIDDFVKYNRHEVDEIISKVDIAVSRDGTGYKYSDDYHKAVMSLKSLTEAYLELPPLGKYLPNYWRDPVRFSQMFDIPDQPTLPTLDFRALLDKVSASTENSTDVYTIGTLIFLPGSDSSVIDVYSRQYLFFRNTLLFYIWAPSPRVMIIQRDATFDIFTANATAALVIPHTLSHSDEFRGVRYSTDRSSLAITYYTNNSYTHFTIPINWNLGSPSDVKVMTSSERVLDWMDSSLFFDAEENSACNAGCVRAIEGINLGCQIC